MKFAYLIMAHERFDVLKELLKDLDDGRNDIFLHIDKKVKQVPIEELKGCVQNANLIFVKRIKVYWGHCSQIQCVLNLLDEACNFAFHDYYHLLVGVEFPIVSQNQIFDFFEKNYGYEYIGFDNEDTNYIERIKFFYIFSKNFRNKRIVRKLIKKIISFEKKIGIDRCKNETFLYKKGYANWSISHDLAKYILGYRTWIIKRMRFTFCADEIFFHTLVYNSDYRKKIYDRSDEYHSCMRLTTWKQRGNQFHMQNIHEIIDSDKLFVRKLNGNDALSVIREIKYSRDLREEEENV